MWIVVVSFADDATLSPDVFGPFGSEAQAIGWADARQRKNLRYLVTGLTDPESFLP